MTLTLAQSFQSGRHDVAVWQQGHEKQCVVVIDDYLDDPDAYVEIAAQGPPFTPIGPYYPGIRAAFPDHLLPELISPLGRVLCEIFNYTGAAHVRECNFSMVTTKPSDLMPIQRLPHFDSFEDGRVAALLFLGKGVNNGGTAFYRQRSTGFETVSEGRYPAFSQALTRDVDVHGLPQQDYIDDTNPMYETIAVHEGKFNRMVVYSSATLHSGRIPHDFAFSPDPRAGRLTVNAFLGADPS